MKQLPPFESWPFKTPNIKNYVKKLDEATKLLQDASTDEEALAAVKKHNRVSDKVTNELVLVSVCYSIDVNNPKYKKAMDILNEQSPLLSSADNRYAKALVGSSHRKYLEEKLGTFLFTMYENQMKAFDDRIMEDMVEENKLTTAYDSKIASCQVSFRGGTYNLPQMGKFMEDADRETRKEASEAYYAYLSTIKDELEDIYDKLVKVRTKMAQKLGYKNYVELGYIRMNRFDYNQEDVAAYRKQINEIVTPMVEKIMRRQFKRVGISSPKVYDMGVVFKDGNPIPLGNTQDKIESAKKMYKELSPETDFFFNYMADHHVLDLDAKPGKQSGGYMTYFPVYKIDP